ncbi:MAG: thymidine phosphorylase [candidate division Zixibacteria bacterium]|nr:thymidine phosphorylase [candidate division Zixibacteria bacterium]
MAFQEIISKKRDGNRLNKNEIDEFIAGYTSGKLPDYQVSALLMAIYFRGMDVKETYYLTDAMLHSGSVLGLSEIETFKIDKHSTGGVGDKVSLMLAPMAAACGLVVPMVSGRGLGHTGGTLDKLESIPGYRTDLKTDEFIHVLKKCGASIIGQTSDIAPADKKIYALRDVTATVESIPLITASILSKKLASGIDGIVFDIKCGNGAFMKTEEDATALATSLVETAKEFGKKCRALITSMSQPLGNAVGNSLEVIEVIEYLKGNRPADLDEVVINLGIQMLIIGEITDSEEEAKALLNDSVDNGTALIKFGEMVSLHGGNAEVIDDYTLFDIAPVKREVLAGEAGFILKIDTMQIGLTANALGAGRTRIDDDVDFGVGIVFHKKIGDNVEKGELIAVIYARTDDDAEIAKERLRKLIVESSSNPQIPMMILKRIK